MCGYLPRPAMGSSILPIHHPVSIGLDSRCATSINYENIIKDAVLHANAVVWIQSIDWVIQYIELFHPLLIWCCAKYLFFVQIESYHSPYAAWSSRRARVCSMVSVGREGTPSLPEISSLIPPHSVCQLKHRLHRPYGNVLSASTADWSWEELPVPQMDRTN